MRPYVGGMLEVSNPVPGIGFFPGGDGLWKAVDARNRPPLPRDRIMVVGNNFQCADRWKQICNAGTEDIHTDPTWRTPLRLL